MRGALLAVELVATTWARRLALLGSWLLLAVAVVTVTDALLRYLVGRPIQGTFEATELALATIIFFAMPYTALTDGHVSVDLLACRFPARVQWALIGANALVCAVTVGFIAAEMGLLAVEYVRTARTTITARIPVSPFILLVTGAAWLTAAAFAVQAVAALGRAARTGPPPGSEASP
jgi:TRAP-type C4-dicarboxylate transport system permease small subunit